MTGPEVQHGRQPEGNPEVQHGRQPVVEDPHSDADHGGVPSDGPETPDAATPNPDPQPDADQGGDGA